MHRINILNPSLFRQNIQFNFYSKSGLSLSVEFLPQRSPTSKSPLTLFSGIFKNGTPRKAIKIFLHGLKIRVKKTHHGPPHKAHKCALWRCAF